MRGLSDREWVILHERIKPPQQLVEKYGHVIAQLMVNRDADESVFDTFLSKLIHYRHIPNIEDAVERIASAVKRGERILIYGDYDVDGITGSVLLYDFLKNVGAKVYAVLPTRDSGYGLNMGMMKKFERYADLLITVDNGTTAVYEINQSNIPVIVVDHHNPMDVLPNATLINPKLGDSTPKDLKEVSSVALAFYLVILLNKEFNVSFDIREYLYLVGVGTLADAMPINPLNRILVANGLRMLNFIKSNKTRFYGMKVLLDYIKPYDSTITSKEVVFSIAPRLNAPGRVHKATLSMKLLLAKDEEQAKRLLEKVEYLNNIRREMTEKVYVEIVEEVKKKRDGSFISVALDGFEKVGILGILAGRIANNFGKPTAVFSVKGNLAVASARGVEGLDLYEGLKRISYMFERWGGHTSAVGLTIKEDRLKEFEEKAQEIFSTMDIKKPQLLIDMELHTSRVDDYLVEGIRKLEPFGEGFPEPVFASEPLLLDIYCNHSKKLELKTPKGLTFVSWDPNLNRKLLGRRHYTGRVAYSIDSKYKKVLTLVDLEA